MKATTKFLNDWTQTFAGDLVQGGELAVDYDLSRLPAHRDKFRGAALWDILALARFQPDAQILAASLTTPVYASPAGMIVDRSPVAATFPIPGDAAQVELWFLNIGYARFGDPAKAWDSHFEQNYMFPVRANSPAQPVALRQSAQPTRDIVNAFLLEIQKQRFQFGTPGTPGAPVSAGSELRTRVKFNAWVKNIAYEKNVWFDAHVFDSSNQLVHAQTLPLHYKEGRGSEGDVFEFR